MVDINTVGLRLIIPEGSSTEQKGEFFESFIARLLAPMGYGITKRLRFTGMEIDLLAKHKFQPHTVLVECKAHEDNLSAEVILKALGSRQVRKADAAWLFTTADLTKDGRGLWEDIQNDPETAKQFTWYAPSSTVRLLLDQKEITSPDALAPALSGLDVGEHTLVITPAMTYWHVQLVSNGLPKEFVAFNAATAKSVSMAEASPLVCIAPALEFRDLSLPATAATKVAKTTIARVASGDDWEDPRPSHPDHFIGRKDLIKDLGSLINQIRCHETATRVFSVEGPSGWGKSSLWVKLAQLANKGTLEKCTLTAIDTRSATDSLFVCEAVRACLEDARKQGLISESNPLQITSQANPLESDDVKAALAEIAARHAVVVLVFDQFEELFSKESLFETFKLVKLLSFAVDAQQLPLALGFAWKTDISLPQQHPAYYLWHDLADRRKSFTIREFGNGEIRKAIGSAERHFGMPLDPAIRSRLTEQCQGLPWLLKKLVVHILTRIPNVESQHELLERELDVEVLFKDDLSRLSAKEAECLKYVAQTSPASVATVEALFSPSITNRLIGTHLLVRSGMNYTVYWDIFRDYLVENKVPKIPWARTFQREPGAALTLLTALARSGEASLPSIAKAIRASEPTCQNTLSDLFALQMVHPIDNGLYRVSDHVTLGDTVGVARFVAKQLMRHRVYLAFAARYKPGDTLTTADWVKLFAEQQTGRYSARTTQQYAMRLRLWLTFAGLLDDKGGGVLRPSGESSTLGRVSVRSGSGRGLFLPFSAPVGVLNLGRELLRGPCNVSDIMGSGRRNMMYDGCALGIFRRASDSLQLAVAINTEAELDSEVRRRAGAQHTVQIVRACGSTDRRQIAHRLMSELKLDWKEASQTRYANCLLIWATWLDGGQPRARRKRGTPSGDSLFGPAQ